MDFDRRGIEIIEAAEAALAQLAAKAAAARNYDRATSLLALARRVGETVGEAANGVDLGRQVEPTIKPQAARNRDFGMHRSLKSSDRDVPSTLGGDRSSSSTSVLGDSLVLADSLPTDSFPLDASPASSSTTANPSKKHRSPYPRFKREDDTLVKIGWSKTDKATYEHRSPRDLLDRLVRRVAELGATGYRFTTEQLLPLTDAEVTELPSYQVYLCLAWLVTARLIERHGRQGYTVENAAALPAAVEAAWAALPRR